MPYLGDSNIYMTLLVTLPLDSIVSPLVPKVIDRIADGEDNKDDDDDDASENIVLFNSFSFEDYAWRIYHERLLFKDPLNKYRTN